MFKKIIYFLMLLPIFANAQLVGKVTDIKGTPLPYVNIYLQNSYAGTTTNDDGNYELPISEKKEYTVIFQFLGFKTATKKITVTSFPAILNVAMEEESVSLSEVVINTSEDPAYRIIRNTIAQRKENIDKLSAYTADFYSRGLWKVKDVPEKILGQEVGDFDGVLDSTRTGIVYLSETISKIAYQKPNDFTEKIIASKVSGNDNGFSFNSAQSANISFYENSVNLNAAVVSPIATGALTYYNYKLDGVFYEGNKLINKIKVTPKRPKDRVWSGFIYIVEDDWQLYGVDLTTTGAAIQVPFITTLVFKQNFKFDADYNFWVKILQTVDFGFGFMGFNGDGKFIAVYSNYDFTPDFNKKSFTNEVLSFENAANKKDSIYWKGSRPVPLTDEELKDYIKKDSLQTLRKSKPYLDSIDAKRNRFKLLAPITGYTYKNSYEKFELSYDGPIKAIRFNTVQGWNSEAALNYSKDFDENETNFIRASLRANYGISEDRLRFVAGITRNFNWTNKLRFSISGGTLISQFNDSEPISSIINTVSTLFFERNFAKYYELNFGKIRYSQELFNGLHLYTSVAYENRKPLFNTTDYVTIPFEDVSYTSNNPFQPNNFNTPAITEHNIVKTQVLARINFAQKYFSNPDMKFNVGEPKYPQLSILVENGAGIKQSELDFTRFEARLNQDISLGNKGQLYYNLKGGTFINGDGISFVDFKHFNGNQTRVGTSPNYTDVFNLLPYYQLSTNTSYFEGHLEHDFRGWILGKIPGINQLNFNLVAGAHVLSTQNNKPYSELSIGLDNLGFGKLRLLRVDYVRSFYNGGTEGAFIFGLKFLDLIRI